MRLPFTREQFFALFVDYNRAVWPAQILLLLCAIGVVLLASRSTARSRTIGISLAIGWIWMALAYHLAFFTRINQAAFVFAVLFLAEAALILWHTLRSKRLEFVGPRDSLSRVSGWILIVYALVAYPTVGYALGHHYPAMPTFGLPCPTTILTFGLFVWAARPLPWTLMVVPVLWAAIGTSAALQLDVLQDLGLPLAALLAIVVLYVRKPGAGLVHATSAS